MCPVSLDDQIAYLEDRCFETWYAGWPYTEHNFLAQLRDELRDLAEARKERQLSLWSDHATQEAGKLEPPQREQAHHENA